MAAIDNCDHAFKEMADYVVTKVKIPDTKWEINDKKMQEYKSATPPDNAGIGEVCKYIKRLIQTLVMLKNLKNIEKLPTFTSECSALIT